MEQRILGRTGVAIFGAIFASRLGAELSRLPDAITRRLGSGVHLNPEQARRLPPHVHDAFLQAFADSLHSVFLWGVAFAIVPFLLSWALKEVPLRTTLGHSSELSVEEAAAGATPDERVLTGP